MQMQHQQEMEMQAQGVPDGAMGDAPDLEGDDDEGQEMEELDEDDQEMQEILRGGQEIAGDGEELEEAEVDEEMARRLQMIDAEAEAGAEDEDEGEEAAGEEEEEELIDIDNLADNEKVVLWHYLSEEYEKNPDNLPMPRDIVEQFLADNQALVQRLSEQQQEEEEAAGEGEEQYGEFEEDDDENAAPPVYAVQPDDQPGVGHIDSNEIVVDGEGEHEQLESAGNQDKMYVNENGEYMIAAPIDEDEQPDDEEDEYDAADGEGEEDDVRDQQHLGFYSGEQPEMAQQAEYDEEADEGEEMMDPQYQMGPG